MDGAVYYSARTAFITFISIWSFFYRKVIYKVL